MRRMLVVLVTCGALLGPGGCPPEDYPDFAPVTLKEIDLVRNDATLTPQEQRVALAELGLSSATIDVLLKDKSLANQGGGDLRTAYTKLVAPDFLALTPDEIQIFASTASSVDDDLSYTLTDVQARAIVDFFNDYDMGSPEALAAFLEDTPDAVPGTIPDDVLQDLFIDFDLSLLLPELP
ncbi:MAG: hypothetical protein KA383_13435 [Phycisphaerae bacterium]|nr:hypothetical protein [Phycisphaerae bacterium]